MNFDLSESKFVDKKNPVLIGTVLFILALACYNNFIQDDAFISFRYARNLVQYHNFSWNADDVVKIEGYTNFLWTVLLAAAVKVGIDLVIASKVFSICFGLGTLLVTYKIISFIINDFRYRLLSIFLLGTNYTFSAYMTGGLETQLQTFLISCVCWITFIAIHSERSGKINLVLAGTFTGLAILTRIDSAMICGLFILFLLFSNYKKPNYKFSNVLIEGVFILISILVFVLPWFTWKHSYYGDLLPNSFYLKSASLSYLVVKAGLGYIFSFFASYQLFPIVLIALFQYQKLFSNRLLVAFIIVMIFWLAYIFSVGGDFMEYRFFVPIIPYIIILCTWTVSIAGSKSIQYILVFVMVIGSVSHRILFTEFRGIQAVKTLNDDVLPNKSNWRAVGVRLNQLFKKPNSNISIAVTAAGAIPYYADLKTIDMLGVNDRWIASKGEIISTDYFRPGHNKWTTLDYYLKVDANLIIGQPQIKEKTWSYGKQSLSLDQFQNFLIASLKLEDLPLHTQIIEAPLDADNNFYMLYLTKDEAVDKIIHEQNLKMFDIIN